MQNFLNRELTKLGVFVFSMLGLILFGLINYASAITSYPPGSLLQPNDVTSAHIRDNTIINADVSQTTAFTLSSSTIQTIHTGDLFATSSATLTATTTFGTKAWHFPQTDGTSGQVMTTDGVGNLSLTTISQPYVSTSFTAGEAIAAGDAVSIGDGAIGGTGGQGSSNAHPTTITTTTWVAGATTTPANVGQITVMNFGLYNTYASFRGCSCNVEIRNDNAGTPGSTVLYSGTENTATFANGYTVINHTLTSPLTVTPSTKYWFIWYNTNGNGYMDASETAGTTNKGYVSTDSGSTWSIKSNDMVLGYTYTSNIAGYAYKASAAATNYRFSEFVGFAGAAASTSTSATIQNYGWLDLFTGLSIGQTYYLSNTQGAISTSAGTNSLIVGRAITTTRLGTRNP